mgnify:CR=1 FL=1
MIITRGFGAHPSLVTGGFGPPPPVIVDLDFIFRGDGRSSKRARRQPKEDLTREIRSDIYTVTAQLVQINGKTPRKKVSGVSKGSIEWDSDFIVKSEPLKLFGKVRVGKTNPRNNIFISVDKVIKKR